MLTAENRTNEVTGKHHDGKQTEVKWKIKRNNNGATKKEWKKR